MTPPQPARLLGLFAHKAPICVIARRGPTRYSRLILWDTENDLFTPGQWFRGHLHYATLSSDGRYMAAGIMGAKVRLREDGPYPRAIEQVSIVCRPPFVTALEAWVGGLCLNSVAFSKEDVLNAFAGHAIHKVHAESPCPLQREPYMPSTRKHDWVIDSTQGAAEGMDQGGRRIRFAEGRIYAFDGDHARLLFDTNPMKFEEIVAPDWARNW